MYVRSGDAIAIHYPSGSGIIPYENYPPARSDLQGATFHNVLNTPQRGGDWKPGHIISFAGVIQIKRLAALKVFYDCIEGESIAFHDIYKINKFCAKIKSLFLLIVK